MKKQTSNLYFLTIGKGTPVIFLHGFLLDHKLWKPLIQLLEGKVRMILPDLRGHGKSSAPKGKYLMKEMAEDVLRLMDELGIEKAILAGHSMGGYVSFAFSHLYPQRLSGLALIASHAAADTPERRQDRYKSARALSKGGLETMARDMAMQLSGKPHIQSILLEMMLPTNIHGAVGSLYAMAERESVLLWLQDISVPILLIRGSDDEFVPQERVQEILAIRPCARLVEIPGVGHVPMMEAPQQVAEALLWLISEVSVNREE